EDDGLASGEVLGKRRPGAHPIIAPVSQKGPHATGTWHPRKGFRWSMGHRYPDDARPLAVVGMASWSGGAQWRTGHPTYHAPACRAGRVNLNVVPSPTQDSTQIRPPWR